MIFLTLLTSVVLGSGASRTPQIEGLLAAGPAAGQEKKLALFGQFVGSWDLEVSYRQADGTRRRESGEWHFGWVLEGRAIEDVWRVPSRVAQARTGGPLIGYGATIRFYDPRIDAWRVVWSGVLSGTVQVFTARALGGEIVLEQVTGKEISRWIFSDMTPSSFRWRAATSADGGASWTTEQEMVARRRPEGAP